MAALTNNKIRQKYGCDSKPFPVPVKGGENIFQGSLVGVISGEGLLKVAYEDGYGDFITLGVAAHAADARVAADGELYCEVVAGRHGGFASATGLDEVTAANVGQMLYVVDDNTLALTDGSGTRGEAGKLVFLDDRGRLVASIAPDLAV